MSKLNVQTFYNEVRDRLKELYALMIKELHSRGITMIDDTQTAAIDLCCQLFMFYTRAVRVRTLTLHEAEGKPAIRIHLETINEESLGWYSLENAILEDEFDAHLAILQWVDYVLDAVDNGSLFVKEGDVLFKHLEVGNKVRWKDPAIGDYDAQDRILQESRVYTIVEVNERDMSALIKDAYGETEVYLSELEPYTEIQFNKPYDCEMYNIYTDADGIKHIHILGWFWPTAEGQWRLTEATGLDVPLGEFLDEYEKNPDGYLEEIWQGTKQYEKDCTKDEALNLMRTFFDGNAPEHNIRYSEISENISDGNYMHCTILPSS